jgi:hypothetical protein
MSENDLKYFAMRAEAERALAGESATPQIAALHITMAERYEALASGEVALLPRHASRAARPYPWADRSRSA